jgi:hypothetical protein
MLEELLEKMQVGGIQCYEIKTERKFQSLGALSFPSAQLCRRAVPVLGAVLGRTSVSESVASREAVTSCTSAGVT